MKKAVILLSGGLDSATCLALAKSEGLEVYALSFNYGQRHDIELIAAKQIAESAGVAKHLVVDINMRGIGGSALTDEIAVPEGSVRAENDLIPVTYVPARNTIFLSFALAWAETLHAPDIVIGANAVDYSGYPDCRPEYISAFEKMANLATKVSVENTISFKINTPLINMSKADIIREGLKHGVDYSLTWSCYDPVSAGFENDTKKYTPCLKCDSCLLRARGFKEAGAVDPALQDR
ncbi:MAG: 7-cyano-7-deazaguanine synthase QueC [Nitrospira sp.]|nr:7-cyano-7-deazaguanine synthase QueC [bacterium]MBL7049600.1 7-cyano-7-deazaguanine synthase QueC [Nitrospira sp.]